MTEHILIPLRRNDSIEEVIPYLEFVAHPGMEVIFLMRSSENRYPWWSAHDVGASAKGIPLSKLTATIAQQRQYRSAEDRISTARRVLEEKGVRARLEFCSTSLRRTVRSYHKSDTKIVILLGKRFSDFRQLTSILHRWLQGFGKEDVSPILLLRADRKF